MTLRYSLPFAALSLLASSCVEYGYNTVEIVANPMYQDLVQRTAYLPPMPNWGLGAGELDSAKYTFNEDGEVVASVTTWDFGPDSVTVTQRSSSGEEGELTFFYDVRATMPLATDPDGVTTTALFSLDEDSGVYERTGTRATTRVGDRVTLVVDTSFDEEGEPYESARTTFTFDADDRVVDDVKVEDYSADGITVFTKDSLRYFYTDGAMSAWTHFSYDIDEEALVHYDTGTVSIDDEGFTQRYIDPEAPGDEPYELSFTGPDAGYGGDGFVLPRLDDGTDPAFRSYGVSVREDGEVFEQTYEFYYRQPVSSTRELPAIATTLNAANPIAAGQAMTFGDVPRDATYRLVDASGRAVAAGALRSGSKVAFPQAAAGVYVLTVEAAGFRPRAWKLIAR